MESNEQNGRTVYEVERVEFNVEVDDELFILRPVEPRPWPYESQFLDLVPLKKT